MNMKKIKRIKKISFQELQSALDYFDRADLTKLFALIQQRLAIKKDDSKDAKFIIVFSMPIGNGNQSKNYSLRGSAQGLVRQIVEILEPKLIGLTSKEACLFVTGRPTANFRKKSEFAKVIRLLTTREAEIDYAKSRLPNKD